MNTLKLDSRKKIYLPEKLYTSTNTLFKYNIDAWVNLKE